MQIKNRSLGWMFAIAAVCTCAAFAATVMFSPRPYVSEGILRIRTGEAGEDVADAIHAFVQQTERRSALINIITAENLYTHEREKKPIEDVLEQMQRSIAVTPLRTPAGLMAVRVAFEYPDPHIAQRVTDKLLSSLIDQSADSPTALRVLDPASLPIQTKLNVPLIAASFGALAGLVSLSLLLLLRRVTSRKS